MKKKVGIVSVGDQRHIALISLYTEIFDKYGVDYELICMDRYSEEQNYVNCEIYAYPAYGLQGRSKAAKLLPFLGFKRFAQKIILERNYDFLVIWNENTCLLLSDFLLAHYRGRYCVNVRDIDFPKTGLSSKLRSKTIWESAFSTFCSPYLCDFPKNYPYTIMLSQNEAILKTCEKRTRLRGPSERIRISFIGMIRFLENDLEFIDHFANDNRYVIQFFGAGAEAYEQIIEDRGYNNVVLEGRFPVEKTSEFLSRTDVLNAYYGRTIKDFEISAPAKFYYAPWLYIPAIVADESYMSQIGGTYKFTFPIEQGDTGVADRFYEWYCSLNFSELKHNCDCYNNYKTSFNKDFEQKCIENIVESNKRG